MCRKVMAVARELSEEVKVFLYEDELREFGARLYGVKRSSR
jgi:hypothetical protein